MSVNRESWFETTTNQIQTSFAGSAPQIYLQQRSNGLLQEEMRFAGWFWRSANDEPRSSPWPI